MNNLDFKLSSDKAAVISFDVDYHIAIVLGKE